jgi:hypothetical protein
MTDAERRERNVRRNERAGKIDPYESPLAITLVAADFHVISQLKVVHTRCIFTFKSPSRLPKFPTTPMRPTVSARPDQ